MCWANFEIITECVQFLCPVYTERFLESKAIDLENLVIKTVKNRRNKSSFNLVIDERPRINLWATRLPARAQCISNILFMSHLHTN